MIIKGLRFGMLLQLAVGPICLFIFQTAAISGFAAAFTGVLGVALIDGLYIIAAIAGIGILLNKVKSLKRVLQLFGAVVLMLFGLNSILGTFHISIFPSITLIGTQTIDIFFLKAMFLTLSNPLTILFWAGVFSTKMAEASMKKHEMYLFGLGAVLSTILFLTLIAILGHFIQTFLPLNIINYLNIFVGLVLIYFSIRMLVKAITVF